jgi:hypothetical protein
MTTTINASTSSGLVNTADTSGILQLQTASTAAVTIDASQRVGVTATSPRRNLEVAGTIAAPTALATAITTSANGTIVVADTGGTVGSVIGTALNGSSYDTYIQARNMGASSTPYNLLLQPLGGYVGIQTSGPTNTFQVSGGISSTSNSPAFQPNAAIMDFSAGTARFNATGADNSTYGVMTFNRGSANAGLFAESMRIDASGNVGIGASPNGTKLLVHTTSNKNLGLNYSSYYSSNAIYSADDAGADLPFAFAGTPLTFNTQATERMRITSAGYVGIGNTAPSSPLNVTNSNSSTPTVYIQNTSGSGDSPALLVQGGANNAGTAGAFEVRNYSGGTLFYVGGTGAINAGSTTATVGLGVFSNYGSRVLDFARYADDGAIVGFKRAGTVVGTISVTGSATAYNTSSDYRLKENIAPMQNALNVVQQLKPVTYTWKADGSAGEGFIAHELAKVMPTCVTGEKDAVDKDGNPEYQGIDPSKLVATLTAAIQEQQALITQLQADVAALKGVK